MESARQSWVKFQTDVWKRREIIMEGDNVDKKVKRIYAMYNYKDGKAITGWPTVLANASEAFRTKGSTTRFKFQGKGIQETGTEISKAIDVVRRIASQPNMSIAAVAGADSFYSQIVKNEIVKLEGLIDEEKISEDQAIVHLQKFKEYLKDNKLITDPQMVLGAFLWYNRRNADASGRPFRLYASPLPQYSVPVFLDMVRWLRGKPDPSGLDATKGPQKGKVSMPTPYSARVDRIVMYCKGEEQLQMGVDWFRHYQKTLGKRGLFDNVRPRSTQSVDGLQGIGVSQQPLPNEDILTDAGVANERLKGMSFGMSRAALLYLALAQSDYEFQFRANCRRLVEAAGFDIDQTKLPEF